MIVASALAFLEMLLAIQLAAHPSARALADERHAGQTAHEMASVHKNVLE